MAAADWRHPASRCSSRCELAMRERLRRPVLSAGFSEASRCELRRCQRVARLQLSKTQLVAALRILLQLGAHFFDRGLTLALGHDAVVPASLVGLRFSVRRGPDRRRSPSDDRSALAGPPLWLEVVHRCEPLRLRCSAIRWRHVFQLFFHGMIAVPRRLRGFDCGGHLGIDFCQRPGGRAANVPFDRVPQAGFGAGSLR